MNEAEGDVSQLFRRHDFLLFATKSIHSNGNQRLFQRLKNAELRGQDTAAVEDEVEEWEKWMTFPNFEQIDSVSEGHGLKMVAWLIHTFGPAVTYQQGSATGESFPASIRRHGTNFLGEFLGLDDLVFIFMQVQHNIDKWIFLHRLLVKKQNNGTNVVAFGKRTEDVENLLTPEERKPIETKGYEFPHGAGISGKEAQKRYVEMTKFFHQHYFDLQGQDNKEFVEANRQALVDAITKQIEADEAKEQQKRSRSDATDSSSSKKRKLREQSSDPHYEQIVMSQFSFGAFNMNTDDVECDNIIKI